MLRRSLKTRHRKLPLIALSALCTMAFGVALMPQVLAQSEQQVIVTIKDFTFQTTQMPLQLHMPTVIYLKNEDDTRHDFGSEVFEGSYTQVESLNSITYGRGIGGVFVEPGGNISIRFTIERPGRYEFRCSIHPEMKGEILLMSAGSV